MPPRSKLNQDMRVLDRQLRKTAREFFPEGHSSCCVDNQISIGSFSVRLGSRKKHIQEVIPSRRQPRLELRPVDDVAQFLGKKPEHAPDPPTSPIEDVSFVQHQRHHGKSYRRIQFKRIQQLALRNTP
jgi:hypothetical protein